MVWVLLLVGCASNKPMETSKYLLGFKVKVNPIDDRQDQITISGQSINTVNTFVVVRQSATKFIEFTKSVLGAEERP